MTDSEGVIPHEAEFLLYQTEDGHARVEVRFDGETAWLTQAGLAELFQTTRQNITQHIAAIYVERELEEAPTCKSYLQVHREGSRQVRRRLKHYSLPTILALGYRVRSTRGTQFRQWATARLQEYVVKGFTMDDARLKSPPSRWSCFRLTFAPFSIALRARADAMVGSSPRERWDCAMRRSG